MVVDASQLETSSPRRAAQPILESASSGQPIDWAAQARVRLAVRLARDGGQADAVQPLLALAENEGWNAHTRLLAARSAFDIAPDETVRTLATVLDTLADEAHAAEIDPDDELRGGLLDMLCPTYVSVQSALIQLRPRAQPGVLGAYALFLWELAGRVDEADLDVLLRWVGGSLQTTSDGSEIGVVFPENGDFRYEGNRLTPDPVTESSLVDALIERALLKNQSPSRIEVVAAILDSRIGRHESASLPQALDWVLEDGTEDLESRELRHRVLLAIIKRMAGRGEVGPVQVWRLFTGWSSGASSSSAASTEDRVAGHRSSLIDRSDFAWAIEVADSEAELGHSAIARGMSAVSSNLRPFRRAICGVHV